MGKTYLDHQENEMNLSRVIFFEFGLSIKNLIRINSNDCCPKVKILTYLAYSGRACFLRNEGGNVTMVEPTFKADGFAFVFQKGSILTCDVSKAITSLHEGPEMDKWFKNKATCSDSSTTGSSNNLTLTFDNFRSLFIVAGIASSLALLIYVAMYFHEHRHTLRSIDPETSFWRRIRIVLRLYDQKDPNWDTFNGTQQQCSVHGIIGGATELTEASPYTNSPPTPSSANDIEHGIE